MEKLLDKVVDEPAVAISIASGALVALIALVTALVAGAPVLVAILAALTALETNLLGGAATRSRVSPVRKRQG